MNFSMAAAPPTSSTKGLSDILAAPAWSFAKWSHDKDSCGVMLSKSAEHCCYWLALGIAEGAEEQGRWLSLHLRDIYVCTEHWLKGNGFPVVIEDQKANVALSAHRVHLERYASPEASQVPFITGLDIHLPTASGHSPPPNKDPNIFWRPLNSDHILSSCV